MQILSDNQINSLLKQEKKLRDKANKLEKIIKASQLKLEKINEQWEEKTNYIDWQLLYEEEQIENKKQLMNGEIKLWLT
tara:strand:- start:167 stop:403 length:237 start_codon:yes stop_codon:yes gene_type:complete